MMFFMAQVIVIEPHKNLRDLLKINLSSFLEVEVIPKANAAEALALLSLLPTVSLVICRDQIEGEQSAADIVEFMRSEGREFGLIVMGELPEGSGDIATHVDNPLNWEMTIEKSAKLLGIDADSMKKVTPEYAPIDISYFLTLDTVCCDVYIRIKKSSHEYQFIKRIHEGDTFSKTMIHKYLEQGLKNFYIPHDMQKNFANHVSDQLVLKLNEPCDNIDDHVKRSCSTFNIALNEIHQMGFTSATIQLVEAIIDDMMKTIENSPNMSPLLHGIINSQTDYLYQHSYMSVAIASQTLKTLGLSDLHQLQKVVYASFFKDFSLFGNDELVEISSFRTLEESNLSEEHWDLVFNHSLEGAVLIRKHPEAPIGTDELIKHHHGATNGKGFGTQSVETLPLLSQVFVLVTDFVNELLIYKKRGEKPQSIVNLLFEKYPYENCNKILSGIEKTLAKK
jgi:HD-GYP domain-containing protein (c-di-GMP phosphodiesterase class II)